VRGMVHCRTPEFVAVINQNPKKFDAAGVRDSAILLAASQSALRGFSNAANESVDQWPAARSVPHH
jgi:hypothetical protein